MGDIGGQLAFVKGPGRLLHHKFKVLGDKLSNRSSRMVPRPLWLAARHILQVFHDLVCCHDVRAGRSEVVVRFQFGKDMLFGMTGVQEHNHHFPWFH